MSWVLRWLEGTTAVSPTITLWRWCSLHTAVKFYHHVSKPLCFLPWQQDQADLRHAITYALHTKGHAPGANATCKSSSRYCCVILNLVWLTWNRSKSSQSSVGESCLSLEGSANFTPQNLACRTLPEFSILEKEIWPDSVSQTWSILTQLFNRIWINCIAIQGLSWGTQSQRCDMWKVRLAKSTMRRRSLFCPNFMLNIFHRDEWDWVADIFESN